MAGRVCLICGKRRPLLAFRRHGTHGHRMQCTDCTPSKPFFEGKTKAFVQAYGRKSNLKCKFGMTVEQYESMFKTQKGKCAICGQPERFVHPKTKRIAKLAVDHCHDTGKIRKLLCARCNRGLGYFQHDPMILKKAEEYLHDH